MASRKTLEIIIADPASTREERQNAQTQLAALDSPFGYNALQMKFCAETGCKKVSDSTAEQLGAFVANHPELTAKEIFVDLGSADSQPAPENKAGR